MELETLLELRAGLMALADGKLVADPRKGVLRVCQDETGLCHLCWLERDASGTVAAEPEKDIVILPGESTFGKIPRPGSRVFELKFPEEKHRNLFFWAQEPAADEDDAYVEAINAALNDSGDGSGGAGTEMDADSPGAPHATPAAPPAAGTISAAGGSAAGTRGAGGIAAADLAAVLGNILAGGLQQQGQQRQRMSGDPGPTLGDVLRPELLAPLLQSPEMVERLAPFLPEEHRSAAAISELVSTPQFRHQLDLLSHALMTGQLDTSQFGLPAGGFGVMDFLRSIQTQADKETATGQQQQQQGEGQPQ